MTDGEITFHLREICPHWTFPRMTSGTAAMLEQEKLIEFSADRREVRLTPDGVRRKTAMGHSRRILNPGNVCC